MGQMTQRVAPKPTHQLYAAAPLQAVFTLSTVDQSAELRRLQIELARTKKALKELKEATAHMVRNLI